MNDAIRPTLFGIRIRKKKKKKLKRAEKANGRCIGNIISRTRPNKSSNKRWSQRCTHILWISIFIWYIYLSIYLFICTSWVGMKSRSRSGSKSIGALLLFGPDSSFISHRLASSLLHVIISLNKFSAFFFFKFLFCFFLKWFYICKYVCVCVKMYKSGMNDHCWALVDRSNWFRFLLFQNRYWNLDRMLIETGNNRIVEM